MLFDMSCLTDGEGTQRHPDLPGVLRCGICPPTPGSVTGEEPGNTSSQANSLQLLQLSLLPQHSLSDHPFDSVFSAETAFMLPSVQQRWPHSTAKRLKRCTSGCGFLTLHRCPVLLEVVVFIFHPVLLFCSYSSRYCIEIMDSTSAFPPYI